jgi:hypothetical protein
MLNETTTRTFPFDTYPVRIDPKSVTPGTAFFITESHSGIIAHVVLDGSYAHPLQTWEATVPAKLQKMGQKSFLSPRPESTVYSGLVKFRWPIVVKGQWNYVPVKEHPFYSLEQYSSEFYKGNTDFVEAVAKRIDQYCTHGTTEGDRDRCRFLKDRIPIVLAGYKAQGVGDSANGRAGAPGRDGMVTLLMDHLPKSLNPINSRKR